MKKTLLLPAAFAAGFAWAGSATPAAPEIRDGNGAGDSVFVLDCREPQSDSVYIWKCDSVFVEDSIAAVSAPDRLEVESDPEQESHAVRTAAPPVCRSYSERRTPWWVWLVWGTLEVIAHSDDGDEWTSKRADRPRQLFQSKSERPSRERGSKRR